MIDTTALAARLEAAGVGVVAKTIFLEGMPADLEKGVMIRTGHLPQPIDYELPGYRHGKLQVIARARKKPEAIALARAAAAALTIKQERVGTMLFRYMRPTHDPLVFPASDGNMIEASVNFDLRYSF